MFKLLYDSKLTSESISCAREVQTELRGMGHKVLLLYRDRRSKNGISSLWLVTNDQDVTRFTGHVYDITESLRSY